MIDQPIALKWYDTASQQIINKSNYSEYNHDIYLIMPTSGIIPFQIIRNTIINDKTDIVLTLVYINGGSEVLSDATVLSDFEIITVGEHDYIIYKGNITMLLDCGIAYLRLYDGVNTFESERFKLMELDNADYFIRGDSLTTVRTSNSDTSEIRIFKL